VGLSAGLSIGQNTPLMLPGRQRLSRCRIKLR